jgi:predicted CopG family antitoxin
MPKYGTNVRLDDDVYNAVLERKHGKMSMSDVIADLLGLNEEDQDDEGQLRLDDYEDEDDDQEEDCDV